jgi:hydroxyacyl-ACP dehydratase HTD2-like protein with hotdog domain
MTEDQPLIATAEVQPNEVDLFMFSAVTWLTHRIHFDREYARTEGFPDLVVHGPLQGAYLAELMSSVARRHGGRLKRLSYRHHRTVFCGDKLTLTAMLTSVTDRDDGVAVELEVRVTGGDELATSGHTMLWLPDRQVVDRMVADAESAS